ncbi:spermine/spermidine synthase [Coprinopsis cinerea okayama7|uniref:Spermine/spermidine synthase n=1 Tax=Coprinopsis cinerea (strain Okayama-7 / 130 / ATCC MYA-4618 / FGSC 9003) TaxID=240176 RepID=A8NM74_COPC7|nr:spermine/spermidine synthase [Coprinopsis cinerea okayama7\|eukprot:XP_001834857.2 spermine/spermidine synthase [Coprinopsis cinerea okayama7\
MSNQPQPVPLSRKKSGLIAAIILPLSLILYTYERALVPIYSSGPTKEWFSVFVAAGAALAALNPISITSSLAWLLIAVALTIAPNANYWVAVWTARYGKAVAGVSATHTLVLLPIVFLISTAVMVVDNEPGTRAEPVPVGQRLSRAAVIYLISSGLDRELWSVFPLLNKVSESQIYLGLAAIFYLLWILSTPLFDASSKAAKGKGKKTQETIPTQSSGPLSLRVIAAAAFTALFAVGHPFLKNPVLPHPLPAPYTYPDGTFRVLSAVQSVTGLISVVDWLPPPEGENNDPAAMHSARYLRASHSILGGVWTHEKVMVTDQSERPVEDSFGTPLGDSIYATFVLQEAVRMINSTAKGGKLDNALIIGLGIGTAATSLMRHGVSTTIVEIDPAVYDAARTWFGLPDPGADKVFLEDARYWVEKRKACTQAGECPLFDTVIHDCFSGGGVPQHLYTDEFWKDLKSIVKPEGSVVVNFAGVVNSEATRLVLNTLLNSFDQCRAFHDFFDEFTEDIYNKEFINMVLFCTSSKKPLTFRKGRTSDYLGSPLRRHVLSSLDTREVDLAPLTDTSGKYLVTDDNNPLGKLQDAQGAHHWEVMRTVLPNSHWETY